MTQHHLAVSMITAAAAGYDDLTVDLAHSATLTDVLSLTSLAVAALRHAAEATGETAESMIQSFALAKEAG